MNILFYLDHSISSCFGGIEHATKRVAHTISNESCKCYYAYRISNTNGDAECTQEDFCGNIYVPNLSQDSHAVFQKLQEWKINVVIVQSVFDDSILVWRSLIGKLGNPCKLIFAYHYNPGSEFDYLRDLRFDIQSLIEKIRWRRYVKRIYNIIWKTSDKVVVLSKSHITPWMNLSSADSKEKFVVIPNMNSFEQSFSLEDLSQKEKNVLIVSRLSEHEKNISRLLKLWKRIEENSFFNDWNLVIVGDGPDRQTYENYAKENLCRYFFTGRQPSQEYFKKAPLFIMSSAQEGWGLVITEAQQMGCVPIVFNTFSSAKDIIIDQENGFLVDNEKQFLQRLKLLMQDSGIRDKMAENAMETSHRFEKEKVANMWLDLLR